MSNQNLILFDIKGRIATITINRPDKANSCNISMLQTIHESLIKADEDEKAEIIERMKELGYM